MIHLTDYFAEYQLPELKKIAGILAAGDVQLAGTLLEGRSLYTSFIQFLSDTYRSNPQLDKWGIVNLFGHTLYYGLFIRIDELPHGLGDYLEGKYDTYALVLKDRIVEVGDEHLLMGFGVTLSNWKSTIYNNGEISSPNIEKCLLGGLLGWLSANNTDVLDHVPNNIKHLNLLIGMLFEFPMQEEDIDYCEDNCEEELFGGDFDGDEDLVYGGDDYEELSYPYTENTSIESDESDETDEFSGLEELPMDVDLSNYQCLETLFIRYFLDYIRPIKFPKSLQYLRCEFATLHSLCCFLNSEMEKLVDRKGLTIVLSAGNDDFLSNNDLLRKYGFSYDNYRNEFIVKI